MSLPELRSHFTLRTGFRKGIFPDAPGEYISLYVTETMMLIGVKDVEEAWVILQKTWQTYSKRMLPGFFVVSARSEYQRLHHLQRLEQPPPAYL